MLFKVCEGCENYIICKEYQRICSSKLKARITRARKEKYDFKGTPGVEGYKSSYIMEKGLYIAKFTYKSNKYEMTYVEEKKPTSLVCVKKIGDKELKLSCNNMEIFCEQYNDYFDDLIEFRELLKLAKIEKEKN